MRLCWAGGSEKNTADENVRLYDFLSPLVLFFVTDNTRSFIHPCGSTGGLRPFVYRDISVFVWYTEKQGNVI